MQQLEWNLHIDPQIFREVYCRVLFKSSSWACVQLQTHFGHPLLTETLWSRLVPWLSPWLHCSSFCGWSPLASCCICRSRRGPVCCCPAWRGLRRRQRGRGRCQSSGPQLDRCCCRRSSRWEALKKIEFFKKTPDSQSQFWKHHEFLCLKNWKGMANSYTYLWDRRGFKNQGWSFENSRKTEISTLIHLISTHQVGEIVNRVRNLLDIILDLQRRQARLFQ